MRGVFSCSPGAVPKVVRPAQIYFACVLAAPDLHPLCAAPLSAATAMFTYAPIKKAKKPCEFRQRLE